MTHLDGGSVGDAKAAAVAKSTRELMGVRKVVFRVTTQGILPQGEQKANLF
jgi:hypothetical protein